MRIKLSTPLLLCEICEFVCGEMLANLNPEITHITFNSAEVKNGDLFFALPGKTFDGNDFVDEAKAKKAYVIAQRGENIDIRVADAILSLSRLAKKYKHLLPHLRHTVAITGSVGKTTTKNIVSQIVSSKYVTHATHQNLNNVIGVVYTILSAPRETEVLVIEAGMNHRGELHQISKILEPSITVITNIGSAHIGNLGTREEIARAKQEINDFILPCGKSLVPSDERLLDKIPNEITVSTKNPAADAFLIPLQTNDNKSAFDFYFKRHALLNQRVNLSGEPLLSALSFALTIAFILNLNNQEIGNGLTGIDDNLLRYRKFNIGKYRIIDDSYSASPEAVITMLKSLRNEKAKSAVLGDMLELGERAKEFHQQIGLCAANEGFKKLFLVGEFSDYTADGAMTGGISKENIYINYNIEDISETVKSISSDYDGEALLIKGSHALRLHRIIEILRQNER